MLSLIYLAPYGENEQREYDQERTAFLNHEGVKVIRFWNDEVLKNLDSVVEKIVNSSASDSTVSAPSS